MPQSYETRRYDVLQEIISIKQKIGALAETVRDHNRTAHSMIAKKRNLFTEAIVLKNTIIVLESIKKRSVRENQQLKELRKESDAKYREIAKIKQDIAAAFNEVDTNAVRMRALKAEKERLKDSINRHSTQFAKPVMC